MISVSLRTAEAPTGAKPGSITAIDDHTEGKNMSNIIKLNPNLNLPIDRILVGMQANWSAETKWVDRDGLPIPQTPKLVLGMRTFLRRWLEKKPLDIIEHPLPNIDELNASVPKPWPIGLSGQEEPPYALYYAVHFCDPATGALYTFVNKTYGSKIAYERLEEQVAVTRALRGANVFPVVLLDQVPMKTVNFGMKSRPNFNVIEFKVPPGHGGESDGQLLPRASSPQLSGPTGAAATRPSPASSTAPASASPVPEIQAPSTLDQMTPAKPVTVGEIIKDELPHWA